MEPFDYNNIKTGDLPVVLADVTCYVIRKSTWTDKWEVTRSTKIIDEGSIVLVLYPPDTPGGPVAALYEETPVFISRLWLGSIEEYEGKDATEI